jgi:hypothetical protein
MTLPDDILEEAANRFIDDREYMTIDAPDEVEPADDEDDES